jgi:hypothetical protein
MGKNLRRIVNGMTTQRAVKKPVKQGDLPAGNPIVYSQLSARAGEDGASAQCPAWQATDPGAFMGVCFLQT